MSIKRKLKNQPKTVYINLDENGEWVSLLFPFAGIWYDTEYVKMRDQDAIDDARELLAESIYMYPCN